jgi:hypothetical protein
VRGEAAITGVDIAAWRQVVVTTGKDKSLRLWNISEKKMEASHMFEEEPTALAMHPSGLYAAVAFPEKVQIMSLLLDGFSHCRDLNLRGVNMIRFSRGGQFVACCAGTVIMIYHTHTGVVHCTLRGHTNRVKSLVWLHMDARIMSVGAEGATFFWDMLPKPTKSTEQGYTILNQFTSGTCPSDGSVGYLATGDKQIKEVAFVRAIDSATGLQVEGVKEPREVDVGKTLGVLVYDESRKIVIGASCDDERPGSIMVTQASPQLSGALEWNLVRAYVNI